LFRVKRQFLRLPSLRVLLSHPGHASKERQVQQREHERDNEWGGDCD
jgi:hypothetical protein